MLVCLCLRLAVSFEKNSRFDLYSLSALQPDGPSRLVRRHARKQEREPAKGGEQWHENTTTTNPLLRHILGLVRSPILACRSGSGFGVGMRGLHDDRGFTPLTARVVMGPVSRKFLVRYKKAGCVEALPDASCEFVCNCFAPCRCI